VSNNGYRRFEYAEHGTRVFSRLLRLRMVTGRTNERESCTGLAVEDRRGAAGRGEGRGPGSLRDRCRRREKAAARLADLPNGIDVRRVVDELELLPLGVAPASPTNVVGERSALEDRLHVAQPDGVLRVQLLLGHERRWRMLEDSPAPVVGEDVVVPEDVEHLARLDGRGRHPVDEEGGLVAHVAEAIAPPGREIDRVVGPDAARAGCDV
jgi:hypothetical protein